MSTIWFLADWALRGAALAGAAFLLLRILRVRDVSVRLAAWVAVLVATLALPALLPLVPPMLHASAPAVAARTVTFSAAPLVRLPAEPASRASSLPGIVAGVYFAVALAMISRLLAGLALARGFVKRAVRTEYPGVFESTEAGVPVTIGVLSPAILVPQDWRSWSEEKLAMVLAHEESHVRRRDPAVQFLSALHRAVLWFSPVSWALHTSIARLAEDASDDRALAVAGDAASYAETLLGFVRRAPERALWTAVAMARTASAERRIDRILSGHAPSRGLRLPAAAIVILAAGAATYFAAAAQVAPSTPVKPPRASVVGGVAGGVVGGVVGGVPGGIAGGVPDGDSVAVVSGKRERSVFSGPAEEGRFEALMAQHGDFVWYRRDGKEYTITDPATVAQALSLFDAQEKLGAQQTGLGEKQGRLGEQQEELGRRMSLLREDLPEMTAHLKELEGELERMQKKVSQDELGRLQEKLGEIQSLLGEKQGSLGKQMDQLGRQMDELGKQQDLLGREQSKLGEQQERESAKAMKELQRLIDEAAKKGLAHEPR